MKTLNTKILTVVGVTLIAAACGDDLTDKTYQGEPRFVVNGVVQSLDASTATVDTFVGVVWYNFAKNGDTISTQVASVSDASFPSEFTLALYDEPASEDLNDYSDAERGTRGYVGTGFVVAFDDLDGDGSLTTSGEMEPAPGDDLLRGMAPGHIAIFARDVNETLRTLLAQENMLIVNPEAMVPGFNLARTVCAEGDEAFDMLEIVPNESVPLESMEYIDNNDSLCLNFT
ncbi:MAG: hypothetical protein A2341_23365 [Deltaproteobacteria bacterium RIFOXYB12_FULL_58_9]|nr:MAG: hypothetical protein A2341_23365 [Deltaproteobacteria bacterium RIFOXYB12_FULL_58_9]